MARHFARAKARDGARRYYLPICPGKRATRTAGSSLRPSEKPTAGRLAPVELGEVVVGRRSGARRHPREYVTEHLGDEGSGGDSSPATWLVSSRTAKRTSARHPRRGRLREGGELAKGLRREGCAGPGTPMKNVYPSPGSSRDRAHLADTLAASTERAVLNINTLLFFGSRTSRVLTTLALTN